MNFLLPILHNLQRALKEKELSAQKMKVMRLEKLCRALQAERNTLLGKARSKEGKHTLKLEAVHYMGFFFFLLQRSYLN